MADTFTIQLHEQQISRRGKGAKGTRVVKTFGIPIVNSDGVAKDRDYTPYRSQAITALIDAAVDLLKFTGEQIREAFVRGCDEMQLSDTTATESEVQILAERILAEDLAIDAKDAVKFAKMWVGNVKFAFDGGLITDYEKGIQTLWDKRAGEVASLKEKNLWVKTTLVKTPEVKS